MTQSELAREAKRELHRKVSQSYLSQIENGKRPHLTKNTRELLAKLFKVHPGFLVDDPEGFETHLLSNLPVRESRLDEWLLEGARRFRRDAEISEALERLGSSGDARRSLILLMAILDTPDLVPRLLHALQPGRQESARVRRERKRALAAGVAAVSEKPRRTPRGGGQRA